MSALLASLRVNAEGFFNVLWRRATSRAVMSMLSVSSVLRMSASSSFLGSKSSLI